MTVPDFGGRATLAQTICRGITAMGRIQIMPSHGTSGSGSGVPRRTSSSNAPVTTAMS
jgi:hypothetical protein